MNIRDTKLRFPLGPALGAVLGAVLLCVVGWGMVEWFYNRIYVEPGYSLQLRYKGPPLPFLPGYSLPAAEPGMLAKVDEDGNPLELGVLEQLRGPGRHFYCPLWWERRLVENLVVKPGQVAVVTSKLGKELPGGEFLVDAELGETTYKGILRKVLTPGVYRVNEYAYKVTPIKLETLHSDNQTKQAGWVSIPTGYVGVVTNLTENAGTGAKKGIQEDVLPPGLYAINPNEQLLDVVEIGYREKTIAANLQMDKQGNVVMDASGEPLIADDGSGISFPSNDGFPIHMDFTAIWGIMPKDAPKVIDKFGNVAAIENKVVIPQIESICRNMGSTLGAVDLLVGVSRQQFQDDTTQAFHDVLKEKDITLLYGLVRHIYIPQEVRLPIQQAFIADELKLTLGQQQLTARTEANLREAEQKVKFETERIRVETEKLVAEAIAEGQKTAEETAAETTKLMAAIDRKTAAIEAQATVLLGQAESQAKRLLEEAKADKFRLAVEAFGAGDAYNQWVFAAGLPDDVELNLLYAGDGTFWTDLKGFTETMLGRQLQQSHKSDAAGR